MPSQKDRYYTDKLAAEKLVRVYEVAPPRVRRYLDAEIFHCLSKIRPGDVILELGCGYGRVLARLARKVSHAVGVDTSLASLTLGKKKYAELHNVHFLQANTLRMAFPDAVFDLTLCIQNGLSAFKVDQLKLLRESLRVTRSGGRCLFSSYSDKFWQARLEWFEIQAEEGLLGEIDTAETGDGVIVCQDGFRATTLRPDDFLQLAKQLGREAILTEVDRSSLFCEIKV